MPQADVISAKLEDYLEVILHLAKEGGVARVRDIASRMDVRMPSVTGALKHLAAHGLVNYEPYQYVTLTPRGMEVARRTTRRHQVLKEFLAGMLGLPEAAADQDACGMEHALSEGTLDRLIKFLEFINTCPRAGPGLIDSFRCSCNTTVTEAKDCESCIESCLEQLRRRRPDDAPTA